MCEGKKKRFNDAMRSDSGSVSSGDAIMAFLYLLARDHLPIGVVEGVLDTVASLDVTKVYTNGWLAQWAQYSAKRITVHDVEKANSGTIALTEALMEYWKRVDHLLSRHIHLRDLGERSNGLDVGCHEESRKDCNIYMADYRGRVDLFYSQGTAVDKFLTTFKSPSDFLCEAIKITYTPKGGVAVLLKSRFIEEKGASNV